MRRLTVREYSSRIRLLVVEGRKNSLLDEFQSAESGGSRRWFSSGLGIA